MGPHRFRQPRPAPPRVGGPPPQNARDGHRGRPLPLPHAARVRRPQREQPRHGGDPVAPGPQGARAVQRPAERVVDRGQRADGAHAQGLWEQEAAGHDPGRAGGQEEDRVRAHGAQARLRRHLHGDQGRQGPQDGRVDHQRRQDVELGHAPRHPRHGFRPHGRQGRQRQRHHLLHRARHGPRLQDRGVPVDLQHAHGPRPCVHQGRPRHGRRHFRRARPGTPHRLALCPREPHPPGRLVVWCRRVLRGGECKIRQGTQAVRQAAGGQPGYPVAADRAAHRGHHAEGAHLQDRGRDGQDAQARRGAVPLRPDRHVQLPRQPPVLQRRRPRHADPRRHRLLAPQALRAHLPPPPPLQDHRGVRGDSDAPRGAGALRHRGVLVAQRQEGGGGAVQAQPEGQAVSGAGYRRVWPDVIRLFDLLGRDRSSIFEIVHAKSSPFRPWRWPPTPPPRPVSLTTPRTSSRTPRTRWTTPRSPSGTAPAAPRSRSRARCRRSPRRRRAGPRRRRGRGEGSRGRRRRRRCRS